jgi:hypothetical protein
LNYSIAIPIAVWGLASVVIVIVGGLFRSRRLPPTRHERRVRIGDPGS